MEISEDFKSFSLFASSILPKAAQGKLSQGSHVTVRVFPTAHIADLFVIGRLLALIHHLQETLGIRFTFIVGKRRLRNLKKLGFVEYCNKHAIVCVDDLGDQLNLFYDEEAVEDFGLLTQKSYWAPVRVGAARNLPLLGKGDSP